MKTEIYNIEKKMMLLQAKIDQDHFDCDEVEGIIESIKELINQEKTVHGEILKHILNEDLDFMLTTDIVKTRRYKDYLERKNSIIDMLS